MITLDMALSEIIEHKRFVYIGSGSGWIYIGWATPRVRKFIDKQSIKYLESLYRSIDQRNEKIRIYQDKKAAYERSLPVAPSGSEATADDFAAYDSARKLTETQINYCDAIIRQTEESIDLLKRRITSWDSFLAREVLDIYEIKHIKPNGIAIKFAGPEIGKYWLYDEFKEHRPKLTRATLKDMGMWEETEEE